MEQEVFYPQSLKELLELKSRYKGTIYAGGTDLMVEKRKGKSAKADLNLPLIFIKDIEQLNRIEITEKYLMIGAACSYADLLRNDYIPKVLKDAIITIGGPAVRNFSTIGGNICNASPAADCIPVLSVLDANVHIANMDNENIKERVTSLNEFIIGRKKVDLKENEVVTSISIPFEICKNLIYSKFVKVGLRNAMTLSKFSVCVILTSNGEIHISFGAVAPKFVRIVESEKIIVRKKVKFNQFEKLYKPFFSAIDDQRSTKEYRENTALLTGYKLYLEAFDLIKK